MEDDVNIKVCLDIRISVFNYTLVFVYFKFESHGFIPIETIFSSVGTVIYFVVDNHRIPSKLEKSKLILQSLMSVVFINILIGTGQVIYFDISFAPAFETLSGMKLILAIFITIIIFLLAIVIPAYVALFFIYGFYAKLQYGYIVKILDKNKNK